MSTKTMFKRIALVTVSALGFGVLSSVSPSNAAIASAVSLDKSSITVVVPSTTTAGTDTPTAVVRVTVTSNEAMVGLSDRETVTAAVTAVPTTGEAKLLSTDRDDLAFAEILQPDSATDLVYHTDLADWTLDNASGVGSATDGAIGNGNTSYNSSTFNGGTAAYTAKSRSYFMGVYVPHNKRSTVVDFGVYTVTFSLTDTNGNTVSTATLKLDFVSTPALSGAQITLASVGNLQVADSFSFSNQSSTRNVTATVTNRDGGALRVHNVNVGANNYAPALTAQLWSPSTAGVAATEPTLTLTASDSRTTEWEDSATTARDNAAGDGVYTIYDASTASPLPGINAGTNVLRVRYGATLATLNLTVLSTPGATAAATDLQMAATGMAAGRDQLISNDTSETWVLPLTTKTATLTLTAQTASSAAISPNQALRVVAAWSGSYVTADITPAVDYDQVLYTNAAGNLSIPITNNSPLSGASLTLTISGFANGGTVTAVVQWARPAVTTVTVLDPLASTRVKAGTTNVFTVAVTDQFGNAMSGEILQPSLSDTSDNYSATATYATITTGANGTATWSLTDAVAKDASSDAVTFTSITDRTKTGARTLSYVTTVPTIATLTPYYAYDWDATQGVAVSNLVPSTGIYTTTTGTTRLSLTLARNNSVPATATTDSDDLNDMILYRVRAVTSAGAAATGAVVTVTPGTGAFILNSSDVPSTAARNFVVDSLGDIHFKGGATGTGAISFSITAGSVSASAAQWVTNNSGANGAAGRFVTLTGAATGTSNGDAVPVTVKVTDRYGNPVGNVALNVVASGVGSFAGGATTQTYTTTSSGEFTFLATSSVDAGGTGTFTATATTSGDYTSSAGRVGSTIVDSSLAAGNSSGSLNVTFAAGRNAAAVAAEAATDAALEAIDAANAATDAANLAAEAADAATVAAEEARDAADAATAAVEALASEVATLIAGLKAQITTLANTVAKIAKRVRA